MIKSSTIRSPFTLLLRQLRKSSTIAIILGILLVLCAAIFGLLHSPPPIIGQNCGQVYAGGYASVDNSAEDCLWRAYQHCKSATLVYLVPELDNQGTQDNFTVQPGKHGCAVSDASTGYGGHGSVVTYPCGGLRRQYGGLLFYGCGSNENIFVAHISATIGDVSSPNYRPSDLIELCGDIWQYTSTKIIGSNAATCLVAQQQQCTSSGIFDMVISPQLITLHQIAIDVRSKSPCHLIISDSVQTIGLVPPASDMHIYICNSIVENASTVTVKECGVEGDVKLPPVTETTLPSAGLPFPMPQVVGQSCNTHNASNSSNRDCFWQAYQQCRAATLSFIQSSRVTNLQHNLVVQPANGRCTLADSTQFIPQGSLGVAYAPFQTFACGNMQRLYNELVVANCGSEGELDIP
jgi:hypothetical protein